MKNFLAKKILKFRKAEKKKKKLLIFVLAKVFPIKIVALNGIIISTLWQLHSKVVALNGIIISTLLQLHSKVTQKNLFRCFHFSKNELGP